MKKDNIKKTLLFIKYAVGTIGVSAVIADYKWVGVACLVLGAVADSAIKSYFNGSETKANS